MKKLNPAPELLDCLFLFAVEVLSAVPYLFKLGFYSDDWNYLEALARSSGQGIGAMFQELIRSDPTLRVRPVQAAYLILRFQSFGLRATPYHVCNALVLGAMTALLYLLLRELSAGRWLACAIALVFGVLPHFSSDRFWLASHQAALSMAFAFFGMYALLRSLRTEGRRPKTWVSLAVLALALSLLAYEVTLGLIVACLAWIAVREYRRGGLRHASGRLAGVAIATGLLLLVGIAKSRVQTRVVVHRHFLAHFLAYLKFRCVRVVVEAVRFNLWTYSLHMPAVLIRMFRHSALSPAAVASASLIALLAAAYLWRCLPSSPIPSPGTCVRLIFLGFVFFALGFGLFFRDVDVDFSTPGIENRTTIASALGAACVLIGLAGLACSTLKSPLARGRAYCAAVGLLCGLNCLAVYGIGFYWTGAASQQSAILRTVAGDVRTLPRGSALLLDGFCRHFGPAVVLETDWDTTGALRLALGDPSLTADVVSPTLRLLDATIATTAYGDPEGSYPYGDRLFVFNLKRQTLVPLPTRQAASAYFQAINPTLDSGCPASRDGRGAKVF